MKIEKISDNQIKFLLTNEDLKERQIKLSELAQGSEKAQAFFRDIMTEAMLDCGFDASNTPLMIEAMSVTVDSVVIIVSKVGQESEMEKVALSPKSLDERKFKQEDIKGIDLPEIKKANLKEKINLNQDLNNDKQIKDDEEYIDIYSFKNFDDIISLSKRLCETYEGNSVLYKYEEMYFLTLQNQHSFAYEIDYIVSEYGEKQSSSVISKYYLLEHGEVIIKEDVIKILSELY